MTKDEERILVAKILDGQTELYRELVDRYHRGLIIYLLNMLGDEMQAEDIAQDAFLQAYRKLDTFNPAYSFSTWLYRIAMNMSLRHMAKSKQGIVFDESKYTSNGESPEDSQSKKETKTAIRRAVRTLNPNYQQVINLYYWGGKSYEEISQILGCPIGTVRTWLARSKQLLREELYGQI
jgi:RNA polymerase sigma-70 factor (ECF subfamily)